MDRSIDRTEKRARMFLAAAIIHIFERTGVHKELSHQELSFYISRLMNRTRQGLTVIEGHVPHINKADSLAKVVVTELQEKYGSMLKNMLPQQYLAVEDFVVLCLQKHAKKWFQKREKNNSHKCAVFFKEAILDSPSVSFSLWLQEPQERANATLLQPFKKTTDEYDIDLLCSSKLKP